MKFALYWIIFGQCLIQLEAKRHQEVEGKHQVFSLKKGIHDWQSLAKETRCPAPSAARPEANHVKHSLSHNLFLLF